MQKSTKDILDNINKPFRDYFIKLLELFLNSENNYEFYRRVISFQDAPKENQNYKNLIITKNDFLFVNKEENNNFIEVNYFASFYPVEHRLSLNIPKDEIITFIEFFISKATNEKIPFSIRYILENDIEINETVVIKSNSNSFEKHLEIIREYAKQNPEVVKKFGKPPMLCGIIDGYIGLSDINLFDRDINYTDSRLDLFNLVINQYVFDNLDFASKIGATEFIDLVNYLKNNNSTIDIKEYLINLQLSKSSRSKFVKQINVNSSIISYLYRAYILECKKQNIDSLNPIFYIGSKDDINSYENKKYADFNVEIEEVLNNEYTENIFNFYEKHDVFERFSPKDNIEFIETITLKDIQDFYDDYRTYRDLIILTRNGIIAKNLGIAIEKNIYPAEKVELLKRYFDILSKINENTLNKKLFVSKDQILTLENYLSQKHLEDEEVLEYALNSAKCILTFLENSMVRRAEKERKMQLLEKNKEKLILKSSMPNEFKELIELEINNINLDESLFSKFKKADIIQKIEKRLLSKNINSAFIYELKNEKGSKKLINFD